ncbi:unnamed protein product [Prorocentrum cordatum]|uniref:Uncharacterized protein n=1 Tax=Prorocentrum cordatum TaxID=2364126 RepID=A0ABN9TBU2_9DINO|nr:unnamed protein product [Polarella glacialis]
MATTLGSDATILLLRVDRSTKKDFRRRNTGSPGIRGIERVRANTVATLGGADGSSTKSYKSNFMFGTIRNPTGTHSSLVREIMSTITNSRMSGMSSEMMRNSR